MRLKTLMVSVVLLFAAALAPAQTPPPHSGGSIWIAYVEGEVVNGLPSVYPNFGGTVTIPASHLPNLTGIGVAGSYTANPVGGDWGGVKVDLNVSYWLFDSGFITQCGAGSGTWDTSGINWLNANGKRVWRLQAGVWQEKWNAAGSFWDWQLLDVAEVEIVIDPNS